MNNRKCIVFDLDGTLIDSRKDIANAANATRKNFGLSPLPLETIVSFVGNGMKKLLERTFSDAAVELDAAQKIMMRLYGENLTRETLLYPGVAEGIADLKRHLWYLAVLSNKPDTFCREILRHFGLETQFDLILGGDCEFPLKPDPGALFHILHHLHADAAKSWMFGDHYTDLESGSRASMKTAFATYGFGFPGNCHPDFKAASFPAFTEFILHSS